MTTIATTRPRRHLHQLLWLRRRSVEAVQRTIGAYRTARAHLPHTSRVHAIRCTACQRWVNPRRFDITTMTCRDCG